MLQDVPAGPLQRDRRWPRKRAVHPGDVGRRQRDFDEAAERMQAHFGQVFDMLKAVFEHRGLPLLERQELSLVGYSPRAGKMVNFELTQETRAAGVVAGFHRETVSPWARRHAALR